MGTSILIERDVMASMRDGVRLATDVYRPNDRESHPVLILRTPYNKSNAWNVGSVIFNPLDAVEHGYTVVVQDTRGRFKSEGIFRPFLTEARDGFDTVEWAATQSWSDGNVGIYGSSYDGVTCLQAARAAPPHLRAVLAYVTGANYHNGWTYSGGAFELGFNLGWSTRLCADLLDRVEATGGEKHRLTEAYSRLVMNLQQAFRQLPLRRIDPILEGVGNFWQEWLSHPAYDEYWSGLDVAGHATEIKVPVLHITGWYDIFLRGHLDLNEALRSHQDEFVRDNHRFIIGPWDHEAYLTIRPSSAGKREFGPAAAGGAAFVTSIALQWFDRWLRDRETTLVGAPRVQYFVMGSNVWKSSDEWPPPHDPTPLHFHSGGRANTRLGDGILTSERPAREPADRYVYDPEDPVPTTGGRTLNPAFGPGGVQDQAGVEEREDVLVYTSVSLTAPIMVAGPVSVILFATTSGPDTDFTAKLVDVEPTGYCANIAEGIVRCRYRKERSKAEFLRPGEVVELSIDLWDVAHTFLHGHRIRIEISSSNFPRFDRNLNSKVTSADGRADAIRPTVQQVFHDAAHPSRVVLPLISDKGAIPYLRQGERGTAA